MNIDEQRTKNYLQSLDYKRVLSINPDIEFINDIDKEEFKCIIYRK